jgi:protocatechuate 3,4-dioxygenase beta subunit
MRFGALAIGTMALPACDGEPAAGADADPPAPDAGLQPDGPTPQCEETENNIEGPFYLPGAPLREDIADDFLPGGVRLLITGRVLSFAGGACSPLPGALIDVWQADDRGDEPAYYYNAAEGYRLRGRLRADDNGDYRLSTIVPGHYPNGAQLRPAHIHVKVSAPGHTLLTTQLYFAGDPFNATDPFIHPKLIMTATSDGQGGQLARFDFILA